ASAVIEGARATAGLLGHVGEVSGVVDRDRIGHRAVGQFNLSRFLRSPEFQEGGIGISTRVRAERKLVSAISESGWIDRCQFFAIERRLAGPRLQSERIAVVEELELPN